MFVAFMSLAGLPGELQPADTAYLSLTSTTSAGEMPEYTSALMLAFPRFSGTAEIINYVALRMGRAIAPGGEPWPEERARISRRGQSAFDAVKTLLAARGLKWHEARPSMPKDLMITCGTAAAAAV